MTKDFEQQRVEAIVKALKVNGSLNWAPIIIKADPATTRIAELEQQVKDQAATIELCRIASRLLPCRRVAGSGKQKGKSQ